MGGTGDDEGRSIALDGSGNIFLTGYMNDPSGQAFIAKWNAGGSMAWVRNATGVNAGWGISTDNAGTSYITGFIGTGSSNFGTQSLTAGDTRELFMAAYDSAGTCNWAMNTGGASFSEGYGIATDNLCHSFSTGYFQTDAAFGSNSLNFPGTASDVFIAHADSNCITGLQPVLKVQEMEVYPNPSTGIVHIRNAGNACTVTVYDLVGNALLTVREGALDLSSLPDGIYVLKITGDGKCAMRKLVKD
jgi:hypothetical protein